MGNAPGTALTVRLMEVRAKRIKKARKDIMQANVKMEGSTTSAQQARGVPRRTGSRRQQGIQERKHHHARTAKENKERKRVHKAASNAGVLQREARHTTRHGPPQGEWTHDPGKNNHSTGKQATKQREITERTSQTKVQRCVHASKQARQIEQTRSTETVSASAHAQEMRDDEEKSQKRIDQNQMAKWHGTDCLAMNHTRPSRT